MTWILLTDTRALRFVSDMLTRDQTEIRGNPTDRDNGGGLVCVVTATLLAGGKVWNGQPNLQ